MLLTLFNLPAPPPPPLAPFHFFFFSFIHQHYTCTIPTLCCLVDEACKLVAVVVVVTDKEVDFTMRGGCFASYFLFCTFTCDCTLCVCRKKLVEPASISRLQCLVSVLSRMLSTRTRGNSSRHSWLCSLCFSCLFVWI